MADVGFSKRNYGMGLYEVAAKEAAANAAAVAAENGIDGEPLVMKGHPPGKIFEKSDSTFSLKSSGSHHSDIAAQVEKIKQQVYNSPVKKTNSTVDKVAADIAAAAAGSAHNSPKRLPKTPPPQKEPSPKKKEIWEMAAVGSFSNKVKGWKNVGKQKHMESERPEWMNELPTQKMVQHRRGSSSAEEELLEVYRQQQMALKGRKTEEKKKSSKDKKEKKGDKKEKAEKEKKDAKEKKKKQHKDEQYTKARDHDFKHDTRNQRSKACSIL
uniref:SMAP domain-containing protein n=1 Tax=Steinernema glaseri TaxID=37863 RepID=A0A1I7YV21_9BILA